MNIRDRLRYLIKGTWIHYTQEHVDYSAAFDNGDEQEVENRAIHVRKDFQEALQVLELNYPVTLEEVKQAYWRLCKEYHPDHFIHDKEKQKIAHEILVAVNCAYDRIIAEGSLMK